MAERLFPAQNALFGAAGASEDLRKAILAVEWHKTPAGAVRGWPAAGRCTVRTALLAASPMAVLIGRDGIIICNDAAREVFGDACRMAQGRSVYEILPFARKFYREMIDAAYLGTSHLLKDQPIKLSRGGITGTCWFNIGFSPVIADDGTVFGTLLAASETTDHVRMQRALLLAQDRVEVALEAGGIVGTWDFDTRSRKVILNSALAAQHGIRPDEAGEGIGIETLFENLVAADRPRVLATVEAALARGGTFHSRFRTITKDGALHWYNASGRPVRDKGGAIVGLAGIVIDTTTQSGIAAALAASNLRFETLVEAIPQIVWSTDRHGTHDFFNRRWTEFTGIDPATITPTLWTNLVHPDDLGRVTEAWRVCLETGHPYDIDYRFRHHGGGYRWLRVIALPMRDAGGEIVRWYGTATDIEDAKLLETERDLVNRELDHRIGNLFSLVNAVINLSARDRPHCAALAQDITHRLRALHRGHQLIRHKGDGHPVALHRLLEDILAPYLQSRATAISIGETPLLVAFEAVTSFALLFHELATNAAKYGALSGAGGRLAIDAGIAPDTVTLRWREDGIRPAAETESGTGFGSKLLTAIVEGRFRGTLERLRTPEGIQIDLRLPASLFATAPEG